MCEAVASERASRVALMFPGQGSQFVSMGQELYEEQPVFRGVVQHCARHLRDLLDVDLAELLYAPDQPMSVRDEQLRQTALAQPALFVVEFALAKLLLHYGVRPSVLLGHSIGEYVAACIGGVFELEAALELVAERGRLMQSMPAGAMLAVRAAPEQVLSLLGTGMDLAAHNAPESCVVSGPRARVDAFRAEATARGLSTTELHTSHAFHSAMMDPILEPFARAVERASPKPNDIPILSTSTGALLTPEQAQSVEYWTTQLRKPVLFAAAAAEVCRDEANILVEVGPGIALASCATQVAATAVTPRAIVETLGHAKDALPAVDALLRCVGQLWVHGVALDYEAIYSGRARNRVRIPTYAFQRSRYWVDAPNATSAANVTGALTPLAPLPETKLRQVVAPDQTEAFRRLLEARLGRPLGAGEWTQPFVQLGLDSLGLSQLVARISQNFTAKVSVRQLFGELGSPAALDKYLTESAKDPDSEAPAQPQSERAVDGFLELTAPQQELWLSCKIGGTEASLAYNECRCFRFQGELNRSALVAALDELVVRHQVLRQTFTEDGSGAVVHPPFRLALRQLDASSTRAQAEEQLQAAMRWEVTTPFDLTNGPLIRGALLQLGEAENALLLCAHHVAVDGSSWEVLIRELALLYAGQTLGPAPSFGRFANAEARYAHSENAQKEVDYWVSALSGNSEDLELPLSKSRPKERRYAATRSDHLLDAALVHRLRHVASRASCTLQTVLLGAFAILLRRLTQRPDLLVGVPAAGQAETRFENLVGHSVRVLPIRTQVNDAASLAAHFEHVHAAVLDGVEHRRAHFAEVSRRCNRSRDPSRPSLVQVAFGMGRSQKRPNFDGLLTRVEVVPRVSEHFELYVYATEHPEGLELSWSYRTDLFDDQNIEHWQRCFVTLLESICSKELNAALVGLRILDTEDERRLFELARGPHVARDVHVPVYQRIASVAASTPDAVALVDRTRSVSYRELDHRANQWAELLNELGLERGSLIGVCLSRTAELVAALLGIWRAGLGYVPLDPTYPSVRIHSIVETAKTALVLTNAELREVVPEGVSVAVVEELATRLASLEGRPREFDPHPTDTAYVIFTSGSTGQPKGVQIAHGAFENFVASMSREPGFDSTDTLLAITTISFDIAGLELFLPLCVGGRVVLATSEQAREPRELQALLVQHRVTVLQATPASWQMLVDSGWHGDRSLRVLCGGERFPRQLAERLLETCGDVWNVYGPTETTVWSTAKHVRDAADLSIGRPIDNTNVYVLDEHHRLLPMGASGELCIGGSGVALGYLGQPELTRERFLVSPFEAGDILYRTGDLGRLRNDGEFECLGRLDFQVKIRGFRIETGEVEAAMLRQPGVKSAVVVAHETPARERMLVAYVVARDPAEFDTESLREKLEQELPQYMVPSRFCLLDVLPLTPNNKVDRKALPTPEALSQTVADSPANATEAELLEVWVDLLGHSQLGVNDNLYQAGGHSLMAIRLVERINTRFATTISVNDLFRFPTVRGLATLLDSLPDRPSRTPGRQSSVELNQHRGLFLLRRGKTERTPFLLIHGDKANGLLLPHLPEEANLFGYHHQGSNGERIRLTSVETLAERCHEELVDRVGDGPCVVAGHSFGALVAYHVAVLRAEAGLPTPRAVLVDTRHPATFRTNAGGLLGLKRAFAVGKRVRVDEQTIEDALATLARGEPVPAAERTEYILATYRQATRAYEPPEWDGELEIIRSEEWAKTSPYDGWETSARGAIRRVVLPGTHLTIVREDGGVAALGRWLTRILEEV